MGSIVFFDTETTGLPIWKKPSGSEEQPHIVELAAILADETTMEIITIIDVIISPDGWVIPKEMTDIHGISHERALEVGASESAAVKGLFDIWQSAENIKRACHNRTFDQRMIRIAAKRYLSEDQTEAWASKDDFVCTMLTAKPIMKMLPKGRFGYKNPKLEEAYLFFTGRKLENAHSAMSDTKACMEIYFAMQKLEKEND